MRAHQVSASPAKVAAASRYEPTSPAFQSGGAPTPRAAHGVISTAPTPISTWYSNAVDVAARFCVRADHHEAPIQLATQAAQMRAKTARGPKCTGMAPVWARTAQL